VLNCTASPRPRLVDRRDFSLRVIDDATRLQNLHQKVGQQMKRCRAVGRTKRAVYKVDFDRVAIVDDAFRLRTFNHQQALIDRIAKENATERRRDDCRDARVFQGRCRLFARRAGAEIAPRNQNIAALNFLRKACAVIFQHMRRQLRRFAQHQIAPRKNHICIDVISEPMRATDDL
jgi:hypothetical protein